MHLQGIQLYKENDIFSLFNGLLHLLMKFGAVRSVGVREDDHTKFGLLIPHHQGVFQRDLRNIHSVEGSEAFLGKVLFFGKGKQISGEHILFCEIDIKDSSSASRVVKDFPQGLERAHPHFECFHIGRKVPEEGLCLVFAQGVALRAVLAFRFKGERLTCRQ